MTFPNAHLYLTVHWITAGLSGEVGQFGMRFDNVAPASQALVDACAAAVNTMWAAATSAIEPGYRMQFIRLASVGIDGKYVPGTIAYDHTYSGGVPGGGVATTARFPAQVACVVSLLTAFPRGQAHRGRCYLPWVDDTLQSDYGWQAATVNSKANTFAAMCTSLNTTLGGPLSVFSKGTKAAPTVGAKHAVTQVIIGRRPDVQRRRANRQVELYGTAANV